MKWGWTLRKLPFTTVDRLFGQNSQQQPGEGERVGFRFLRISSLLFTDESPTN